MPASPAGGVALPGLARPQDPEAGRECWAARLSRQTARWQQGRSPCERPRTYDKFYQKLPGNFQVTEEQLGWDRRHILPDHSSHPAALAVARHPPLHNRYL